MYGVVPPDAVADTLTGELTVPVAGILGAMVSVSGLIVILAEVDAILPLKSVALTLMVKVPFAL